MSRASIARHRSRACPRSAVRRRKSGKPDLRGPRATPWIAPLNHNHITLRASGSPALVPLAQAALAALGRDTRPAVSGRLGMTSYARLVFFLARRFFGGGLNTMPSSFMPSGSVK